MSRWDAPPAQLCATVHGRVLAAQARANFRVMQEFPHVAPAIPGDHGKNVSAENEILAAAGSSEVSHDDVVASIRHKDSVWVGPVGAGAVGDGSWHGLDEFWSGSLRYRRIAPSPTRASQ